MVEAERLRQGGEGKYIQARGIISSLWRSISLCHKDRGNNVSTRVSLRVGITAQQTQTGNGEGCFLFCLSNRSLLQRFPVINKTAGERPSFRVVLPLDENNAIGGFDNYIDGRQWVAVRLDLLPTCGTAKKREGHGSHRRWLSACKERTKAWTDHYPPRPDDAKKGGCNPPFSG